LVRMKYRDKTSEPDGRLLNWGHFGMRLLNGRRFRGVASPDVEQQVTPAFPFRTKKEATLTGRRKQVGRGMV